MALVRTEQNRWTIAWIIFKHPIRTAQETVRLGCKTQSIIHVWGYNRRFFWYCFPSLYNQIYQAIASHFLIAIQTFLIYYKCAACPAHGILLDVFALIPAEGYKSCSPSLRSVLHPPVTSFLLHPNVPLSTLLCDALCFSTIWQTMFHSRSIKRQYYIIRVTDLRMVATVGISHHNS